jgi:peptidoglycan/LPS O-acetylase OafA/YrhL
MNVFMPGMDHTWSLAVEEQFYILWPLVLLVSIGRGWSIERVVWVLIGVSYGTAMFGSDLLAIHGSPERARTSCSAQRSLSRVVGWAGMSCRRR